MKETAEIIMLLTQSAALLETMTNGGDAQKAILEKIKELTPKVKR